MAATDDSIPHEPADAEGAEEADQPDGRPCPACGETMYRRHCKYVCPRHGVVYDCADTFY